MSGGDAQGSRRKAALLLVTLGSDISAEVFRHLAPSEVECLAAEISCLDCIDQDEKYDALRAFCGHMDRNRATEASGEADPGRILELVGSEHPQTIALVLSRMEPEGAAFVLRNLPAAMQSDIARRIASIDRAAPETVRTVERVLETRLGPAGKGRTAREEASCPDGRKSPDSGTESGPESLARILECVDGQSGRRIMGELDSGHPGIARAIREALRKAGQAEARAGGRAGRATEKQ